MGRATGAAVTAAAPEARVVGAAARKITPGMAPAEVNGELQRRRKDAAARSAARRSQTSVPPASSTPPAPAGPGTTSSTAPAAPAPTSSGAGLSMPMPAAAATGGGFLLGLSAWAVARVYLVGSKAHPGGGMPAVRQLLAAKFLNKV